MEEGKTAICKERTCCFTGHRPEKLGNSEESILINLRTAITAVYEKGFRTFISGMARGIDLWAAELVLELKEQYPSIRLICASPYPEFAERWGKHWREKYEAVWSKADYALNISPNYTRRCFQIRNEWMVDHSGLVIAAYNGQSGGTRNTILYAEKIGVPIDRLKI